MKKRGVREEEEGDGKKMGGIEGIEGRKEYKKYKGGRNATIQQITKIKKLKDRRLVRVTVLQKTCCGIQTQIFRSPEE